MNKEQVRLLYQAIAKAWLYKKSRDRFLSDPKSFLQKAGLKFNAKKSFFGKPELEYLGYWIIRQGIQLLPKKVLAISNIKTSTTTKEVRSFVGMINYCRDM